MQLNINSLNEEELKNMGAFLKYTIFKGSNLNKNECIAVLKVFKDHIGGVIDLKAIELAFDEGLYVVYKNGFKKEGLINDIVNTDKRIYNYNGVYITADTLAIDFLNECIIEEEGC